MAGQWQIGSWLVPAENFVSMPATLSRNVPRVSFSSSSEPCAEMPVLPGGTSSAGP